MSLDFDGVNDQVTLASQTLGDVVTFAGWFDADSQGESDQGVLFAQGPISGLGNARHLIKWDGTGSSKKLRIGTTRATTSGNWDMTSGFGTLAGWKFVAYTLDISSTTNDPTLWTWDGTTFSTLTVGAGLTETATPSGAVSDADPQTIYLGGDSGTGRSFEGRIGEAGLWTVALTTEGVESLLVNGLLGLKSGNLHLYWPMDSTGAAHALDFSGNARNGTIAGAVEFANPPTRPCGRRG